MISKLAPCLIVFAMAAPTGSCEEIDLRGNWSIATSVGEPCSFTGKATLSAPDATGDTDYDCELTMRHACEGAFEYVVRQTCKVRNIRGQITVQSTIDEILVGQNRGTYAPDNFRLSVQSSNELYGAHFDRYRSPTAVWTRSTGSIS